MANLRQFLNALGKSAPAWVNVITEMEALRRYEEELSLRKQEIQQRDVQLEQAQEEIEIRKEELPGIMDLRSSQANYYDTINKKTFQDFELDSRSQGLLEDQKRLLNKIYKSKDPGEIEALNKLLNNTYDQLKAIYKMPGFDRIGEMTKRHVDESRIQASIVQFMALVPQFERLEGLPENATLDQWLDILAQKLPDATDQEKVKGLWDTAEKVKEIVRKEIARFESEYPRKTFSQFRTIMQNFDDKSPQSSLFQISPDFWVNPKGMATEEFDLLVYQMYQLSDQAYQMDQDRRLVGTRKTVELFLEHGLMSPEDLSPAIKELELMKGPMKFRPPINPKISPVRSPGSQFIGSKTFGEREQGVITKTPGG